jgi:hypothetical protein
VIVTSVPIVGRYLGSMWAVPMEVPTSLLLLLTIVWGEIACRFCLLESKIEIFANMYLRIY